MPPLIFLESLSWTSPACRNISRADAFLHKCGLEAHTLLSDSFVPLVAEENGSLYHDREERIAGYGDSGDFEKIQNFHQESHHKDLLHRSGQNFVALLQACTRLRELERGRELHTDIARKGLLDESSFIGSSLVNFYVKCGCFGKALEVFNSLETRNVVSWTIVIAGYVDYGFGNEALECLEEMQNECVSPDAVTLAAILKACSSLGKIEKGAEVYAEIVAKGLEKDLVVGSTLVAMYSKCGLLPQAQDVFDRLKNHDSASWNALLAGCVEFGNSDEAITCLERMKCEGIATDDITFACILKVYGTRRHIDRGQETHSEIIFRGMENDIFVGNALLEMYGKCGSIMEAYEVFSTLPIRALVSWNLLLAGYVEHSHFVEALDCFGQMIKDGVAPDTATYTCVLKACGSVEARERGWKLHVEITRQGFEADPLVGNALVHMHVKCGSLQEATVVLDMLPVALVASWNALMVGYLELELGEEALACYEQMCRRHVCPDNVTFTCCLKACGHLGMLVKGQTLHLEIVRRGLEADPTLANALVDAYANCGLLQEAQWEFNKLADHTIVSWNTLIAGYAQQGKSDIVFRLYKDMVSKLKQPTLVTFVSVLTVCNHGGLVDEGHMFFNCILEQRSINPSCRHHTCMIDILGRAGRTDEAMVMIRRMPFPPGLMVWFSLLGACRKLGDVELGQWAFEHAVLLDKKDDAAYLMMFNIYTDAGMHEEAEEVEERRLKRFLNSNFCLGAQ